MTPDPPVAELRRAHAAELAGLPRPPVETVTDLRAGSVPARLYRPERSEPLPVLVYFHGGGWVLGDVDSYDPVVRTLTLACGVAFVSVDYRRPPEHPYPAAVDDAVASVRWVARHATEFGLDPARVGVAGDSAGGQIAVAAAMRLAAEAVPLTLQLLVYPAVDLRDGPSAPPWPEQVRRMADAYLRGADRSDPQVSPLLATDLSTLPPTIVATAEHDILAAQGERFTGRLREAGVAATLIPGIGLDHGFLGWGSYSPRAADVIDQIGAHVRAMLGTAPPADGHDEHPEPGAEVVIVTGGCCNPAATPKDEHAHHAVNQAIAATQIPATVHTVSAANAAAGALPPTVLSDIQALQRQQPLQPPLVIIDGRILAGEAITVERIEAELARDAPARRTSQA